MSLYTYEHILASHYSWSLEDIRALDLQDFYVHLRICMEREAVRNEFQAMLAGAVEQEVNDATSKPRVAHTRKLPSGATVETTTEKPMNFRSKVKRVRVNKEGEYIGDV